jgi:hypothetical protein
MNMAEQSQAWVWSHYKGVVSDQGATHSTESPSQQPKEENIEQFKPRLASAQDSPPENVTSVRAKFGYAVAGAVIASMFFPMIAMVLLVIAALLIFSGREPRRAQEILDSIPAGAYISRALDSIDNFLK